MEVPACCLRFDAVRFVDSTAAQVTKVYRALGV